MYSRKSISTPRIRSCPVPVSFAGRISRPAPIQKRLQLRKINALARRQAVDGHGRRDMERIAEAAARWAVEPGAKVAVKIWAVEVLKHCRRRVGWVQEVWDDIVETMAHDATPGIEVRMRKNWREPRRP